MINEAKRGSLLSSRLPLGSLESLSSRELLLASSASPEFREWADRDVERTVSQLTDALCAGKYFEQIGADSDWLGGRSHAAQAAQLALSLVIAQARLIERGDTTKGSFERPVCDFLVGSVQYYDKLRAHMKL